MLLSAVKQPQLFSVCHTPLNVVVRQVVNNIIIVVYKAYAGKEVMTPDRK